MNDIGDIMYLFTINFCTRSVFERVRARGYKRIEHVEKILYR